MQLHWDQFRHGIRFLIAETHNTSHIADTAAGCHGTKSDDLRHTVCAIFFNNIIDNFLAALVAEVNIEVRHGDTFRVQEALEKQIIFHRINTGDTDAVSGNTARTGTSSRADRNAVSFCIVDEVIDDEVVIHISHGGNDIQLVLQTVDVLLRRIAAVVAVQTLIAHIAEELHVLPAVRRNIQRQNMMTELEVHIAAFCDFYCVVHGLRTIGNGFLHLLARLDIEFFRFEFHVIVFVKSVVGLDADEDFLHFCVLTTDVMGVVGCNKTHIQLGGKTLQLRNDALLFSNAMILHFNEVILFSKQVTVEGGCFFCASVIPCRQCTRYFTGKAS